MPMWLRKAARSIWMKLNTNKIIAESTYCRGVIYRARQNGSDKSDPYRRTAIDRFSVGAPFMAPDARTIARISAVYIVLLFSTCCIFMSSCAPAPKVRIHALKGKAYQLLVDNKPYIIKGACYSPIPIGKGNPYDFWSDPNEPWKVDGKLMKEMGINTVRFYQPPDNPENGKKVIRDLYQLYGIRSILGSWLGFWEYPCPRYADSDFREKVKKEVLDMVAYYKDEPGILLGY